MNHRPQLLLRADGGPRTGIGHLMRCLALGQAWQDLGGAVTLMSASMPGTLEARLDREGFERSPVPYDPGSREDARHLAREAAARGAYVALDGYGLGPEYQEIVAESARRTLLVADHGRPAPGPVDLLLDQNLGSGPDRYPGFLPSCKALFGPRYALLRRELRLAARDPADRRHPPRRLLVTLGGGDDGGLGERLLHALAATPLELTRVTVVAGPTHPAPEGLEQRLRRLPLDGGVVRDPAGMVPLMEGADVAVTAAGSTSWELACLGLPAVVVPTADNQEPVAAGLEERGAALAAAPGDAAGAVRLLGRLAVDRELFAGLRERGMLLVDGEGASRAARALRGGAAGEPAAGLTLRPATAADARLLWGWANDPEVRAASFSTSPIPWAEHRRWLAARLADPGTRIFIAADETGEPVGQIRFEEEHEAVEIDVSVAPVARGRGIGARLIRSGCERLFQERGVNRIRARVKTENRASLRAFRRAAFRSLGTTSYQGQAIETLELERESIRD